MSEIRVFKRYQNRKMYDTQNHCYVNLKDILKDYQEGKKVQVICNKSKVDITKSILVAAVVETSSLEDLYSKLLPKQESV